MTFEGSCTHTHKIKAACTGAMTVTFDPILAQCACSAATCTFERETQNSTRKLFPLLRWSVKAKLLERKRSGRFRSDLAMTPTHHYAALINNFFPVNSANTAICSLLSSFCLPKEMHKPRPIIYPGGCNYYLV